MERRDGGDIPGLDGKDTTGEWSTTDTVLSAPHAHPQSQLLSVLAKYESGV